MELTIAHPPQWTMEVFNRDQGDDLTAIGGGIIEDGATLALRTADKHHHTP